MNNKKKKDLIVGSLCALGCETLFGLSYIFTKQVTNLVSPFALMGWRFFIAFIVMSIFIVFLPFKNSSFLIAIFYQGVGCSVLSFFLYNVAIVKIGVNRTSSFVGVSTVVSIIAGVLLLSEKFSTYQVIGVIMIITGVYVANAKENRNG